MAKDSLYVIGPKNLLEGLLNNPGFKNRGAVRYNLAGTEILLEEAPEKFDTVMDKVPQITVYSEEEVLEYLQNNKDEWEETPLD